MMFFLRLITTFRRLFKRVLIMGEKKRFYDSKKTGLKRKKNRADAQRFACERFVSDESGIVIFVLRKLSDEFFNNP